MLLVSLTVLGKARSSAPPIQEPRLVWRQASPILPAPAAGLLYYPHSSHIFQEFEHQRPSTVGGVIIGRGQVHKQAQGVGSACDVECGSLLGGLGA